MQEYYEPEYVSVFYSESLSRFNFKPDIFEQCILISAEKVQERKNTQYMCDQELKPRMCTK